MVGELIWDGKLNMIRHDSSNIDFAAQPVLTVLLQHGVLFRLNAPLGNTTIVPTFIGESDTITVPCFQCTRLLS